MTAPGSAGPHAVMPAAMTRPTGVTGAMSPQPTGESVEQAYRTASPKVCMPVPGAPRS